MMFLSGPARSGPGSFACRRSPGSRHRPRPCRRARGTVPGWPGRRRRRSCADRCQPPCRCPRRSSPAHRRCRCWPRPPAARRRRSADCQPRPPPRGRGSRPRRWWPGRRPPMSPLRRRRRSCRCRQRSWPGRRTCPCVPRRPGPCCLPRRPPARSRPRPGPRHPDRGVWRRRPGHRHRRTLSCRCRRSCRCLLRSWPAHRRCRCWPRPPGPAHDVHRRSPGCPRHPPPGPAPGPSCGSRERRRGLPG